MESQKTISEVIGELIEERGISWAELSRSTGISKSTFSRYKSGEMEPTGKSLVQLSAALGVTTDYLLGIEQTERTKKKKPQEVLICKNCGAEVTGRFCSECGERSMLGDKYNFSEMQKVKKLFIDGEYTETVIRRAAWEIAQSEFENGRVGKEPRFVPLKLSAEFCPDGVCREISRRAEGLVRIIKNYLENKP